jgi:cell pole-organizing protein PopZ
MEDILASIRRILSEEETAEPAAAAAPAPAPAPAPPPTAAVKEWGGGKKDEAPGVAAKEWGGGTKTEAAPGAQAQEWEEKPIDGPGVAKEQWHEKPVEAPGAVQESWQNKPPEAANPNAEGWAPKAPESAGGRQEEWNDKPVAGPGGREEEWNDKQVVGGGAKSWGQDEGRRGRRPDEEDDVLVLTPDMIADDDLELADSGMGRGNMGGASALAQLKRAVAQRTQSMASDRNLALGNGGITIEQLCREILDDLLRDWLNQHLPPMVEKIAKREIQKLVNSD